MAKHKRSASSRRGRRHGKFLLLVKVAGIVVVLTVFMLLFMPNTFRYLWRQVWLVAEERHGGVDGTRYQGIDISHHQGRIDWSRVARDTCLQFVYVKATEGATHVDRFYERNFYQAKAKGLRVGSYHYLTSRSSVRLQARHFIRHCDVADQDLLPMVDVEGDGVKGWTAAQVRDSLWVYVELIRHHYGRYPVIYSYAQFYNETLAPNFNRFYLFIAKYSPEQPVVKGAAKHNIWQITDRGRIDGIKGNVDLDVFAHGTSIDDIIIDK